MRRLAGSVLVILLGLAIYWLESGQQRTDTGRVADPRGGPSESSPAEASDGTIEALFDAGMSDRWVEVSGRVDRVLADDREGSRHQRFILALTSGHTVLVAHNIDLAPRVPLEVGDRVFLRGEYEWNQRGGVVHWTHHDPRGRRQGGFIEAGGRRYE